MKNSTGLSCAKIKKSMSGCPKGDMFVVVNPTRKPSHPHFLHLLNRDLSNFLHVQGAILGAQNTEMSKTDKNPYLHRAPTLMGRKDTDNKC